jgi:hypothetical protein
MTLRSSAAIAERPAACGFALLRSRKRLAYFFNSSKTSFVPALTVTFSGVVSGLA